MGRSFISRDGSGTEFPFFDGIASAENADLLWLHIDGRETQAAAWIAAQDEIPAIARRALMAVETRPRAELIDQGALINLRGLGATPEDDPDPLVSIRLWAERGRVISVSFRSPHSLDAVVAAFKRGFINDPGDLIAAFADAITSDLDPEIASIGDDLDDCEAAIDTVRIQSTRQVVSRLRARAIGYRRFVAPQRQALERLTTANLGWMDEDDRNKLRDSTDRSARMVEELESIRERAALAHDELTDRRSEQLDARGLLLSIVALVFLPLTFLTGLFGMNVSGIPFNPDGASGLGFWAIAIACLLMAVALLTWFIRARWIKGH